MEVYKSFSRTEYEAHLGRLQQAMEAQGLDALLLTMPENVYYATGYRTWYSASLFRPVFCLVGRQGEPYLILRILERTTADLYGWAPHVYCWGSDERGLGALQAADPIDALAKIFRQQRYMQSIGLEAGEGMQYYSSLGLLRDIVAAFPTLRFTDGTPAIAAARARKTVWEIERIEVACKATEAAILDACLAIEPGRTTEKQIAAGIAAGMARRGVDKISYLTVVSGPGKATTFNAYATERAVQPGEVVLVDISGHIDGYASDLTRCFSLGEPSPEVAAMAKAGYNAVLAAAAACRPGVTAGEVNRVCEDAVAAAGWPVAHSSGHGVGLSVVEHPMLQAQADTPLEEGMVLALEQGVYPYQSLAGGTHCLRHEDEVVVTKTGCRFLSGPGEALYIL